MRDLPFRFVQQHYETLRTKLPSSASADYAAYLPCVAGRYCDEEHRAEIGAFFTVLSLEEISGANPHPDVQRTRAHPKWMIVAFYLGSTTFDPLVGELRCGRSPLNTEPI